jgi:hypothetical protein
MIGDLARRTTALLARSRDFAGQIADRRLALEVGVIQKLAESLAERLSHRDPLSQRVHHHPLEMIGLALRGGFGVAVRRLGKKALSSQAGLNGTRR